MRYKSKNRRGILLLMILGLLAMFGMVAVAFVVLSNQALKSSKGQLRKDQTFHPPANDLNEGIMAVLRGSKNKMSKLQPHGLLEDMYGNNSVEGQITGASAVCGGQLTEITANVNLRPYLGCVLTIKSPDNPATGLSTRIVGVNPTVAPNNPQIVAFPNIPPAQAAMLVGKSFIVNGKPFSGTGFGYMGMPGMMMNPMTANMPFSSANLNPAGGANEEYDAADPNNMMLGTPAIPTGSAIGIVNRILPTMHRPALVNYWYYQYFNGGRLASFAIDDDKWNFILHPVEFYTKFPGKIIPPDNNTTPEMLVYEILQLKRNIIGRAMNDDHPNFNGSNPSSLSSYYDASYVDPFTGQTGKPFAWECGHIFTSTDTAKGITYNQTNQPHWDVDTDGDGLPDAIWIDIGLPIRSTSDGRKYKPLVAINCVDLDGRLNLNAHGNLAQTSSFYYNQIHNPQNDNIFPDYTADYFAGGILPETGGTTIGRGRGFGPAEINLNTDPTNAFNSILPIAYPNPLGPPNPPINFYNQLLSGNAATGIEGRYGFDTVPGDCPPAGLPRLFTFLPHAASVEQRKYNDYLSANKWFEFDGLRDSVSTSGWNPASPPLATAVTLIASFPVNSEKPDPSGKSLYGVDPAGRPILQSSMPISPNVVSTTAYNLPYEINLSPQTMRGLHQTAGSGDPPDNPFSVNELERILRPFDLDMQSQTSRLAVLTSLPGSNKSLLNFDANGNRTYHEQEITTESWDLPVFTPALPPHLLRQVQNDGLVLILQSNNIANAVDWLKPKKITDLLKVHMYYKLRTAYPAMPVFDASNQINSVYHLSENYVSSLSATQLLALFPPELLEGLKMNINHAFPGRAEIVNNQFFNYDLAVLWEKSGMGNSYGKIWFNRMPILSFPDPGLLPNATVSPVISPNAQFAPRQLYARYLYILALLLRDPNSTAQWFSEDSVKNDTAKKEALTKRRIAQWAINAACYKINDSIMVPFEYHTKPLDIFEDTTDSVYPYKLYGWQYFVTVNNKNVGKNLDGVINQINPDTNEFVLPPNTLTDDTQSCRRLVWGCKPPEAILTETLAFHNRRIADTNWEKPAGKKTTEQQTPPDPNTDDVTYDQTRIPQGSAFFELYCTRDLAASVPPSDLYYYDSAKREYSLDLGKLAPPDPATQVRYPVWRMVITESRLKSPANNVRNRLIPQSSPTPVNAFQDSASLEPEQYSNESPTVKNPDTKSSIPIVSNPNNRDRAHFSLLYWDDGGAAPPTPPPSKVKLERIVWFANWQPQAGNRDNNRIFWNRSTAPGNSVLLARGQYAVIGPREFTRLGLNNDKTSDPNYRLGTLANESITLRCDPTPTTSPDPKKNLVGVTDVNGTIDPNSVDSTVTPPIPKIDSVKWPLTIIAAGGGAMPNPNFNWPPQWSNVAVTAPMGIGVNISEPLFSSPNYYEEPTIKPTTWQASDQFTEWYGDPQMLDPDPNNTGTDHYFKNTPFDTVPNKGRPLADETTDGHKIGTLTGTLPNYKTVFLQRLANPSVPYDPTTNPYITVDWIPIDLTIYTGEDEKGGAMAKADFVNDPKVKVQFAARQRGITNPVVDLNFNIWAPLSNDPLDSPIPTGLTGTPYFDYDLGDSITNHHSLGYLNKAFWPWITSAIDLNKYRGDPVNKPFPWMPWFGRPYVSEMELMLVPSSSAARMLWEFQPCGAMDVSTATPDYYQPKQAANSPQYAPTAAAQPFPQLFNFLQGQQSGTNTMNQFHRILNYVGVPSWYAGTEIQANPSGAFNNKANTVAGDYHWFGTPYNRISNYREPGRINLNTIYPSVTNPTISNVFNGVMNGVTAPTWNDFVASRRGYGTSANVLEQNPNSPTEFLAPFRSYDGPAFSAVTNTTATNGRWMNGANPDEIQATLLREHPTNAGQPLFQSLSSPGNDVEQRYRNPYFHSSDLMRMANLTTTRSNVYAVWITVGYFEVAPVNTELSPASVPVWMRNLANQSTTVPPAVVFRNLIMEAYPDGYTLGQELGSDTGEIVRHRGFYIIDRSIPVGFQRGQDLNVEKAILLKRFIE